MEADVGAARRVEADEETLEAEADICYMLAIEQSRKKANSEDG